MDGRKIPVGLLTALAVQAIGGLIWAGGAAARIATLEEREAEHQQVALHEADRLGRFVDQDEGQRDQAIDAADRDAAGEDLDECEHGAEG